MNPQSALNHQNARDDLSNPYVRTTYLEEGACVKLPFTEPAKSQHALGSSLDNDTAALVTSAAA